MLELATQPVAFSLMKDSLFLTILVGLFAGVLSLEASVSVTQHHNNPSRDGLYIATAFTQSAAASLTRDLGFNGTIVGNVYAQPLYVEGGPNGPMVIAVTESNNVYALNAATGNIIWQHNVGNPISSGLPCGNITPVALPAHRLSISRRARCFSTPKQHRAPACLST